MCMHVHIHICACAHTHDVLSPFLLVVCVCMISRLIALNWTAIKGPHPWERLILLSAINSPLSRVG